MLSEYIKKMREARGLSQRELARLANLSPAYISRIEAGENDNPSLRALINIARALKVTINDIKKSMGSYYPHDIDSIKTPSEVLHELNIVMPIAVPIYENINKRNVMGYVYIPKQKSGHKNYLGLKVYDGITSAIADEGDIIVIDKDDTPDIGKVVLCKRSDNKLETVKIKKKNDCKNSQILGVAVWVMKKIA